MSKVQEHSVSFHEVVDVTTSSVITTFCLYSGRGWPTPCLGVLGDMYLDLATYDLLAKLSGGWNIWAGPAYGREVDDSEYHWSRFKAHLHPHPSVLRDELSPSSSRFLWCNEDGVYWWTEDEIHKDRRKVRNVPSNDYVRMNGRWIVRRLVSRKYSHLEPPQKGQVRKSADHSTDTPKSGPALKKRRLETSAINQRIDENKTASSSTSSPGMPEQYEGPLMQVREQFNIFLRSTIQSARQEAVEDTVDLRCRLEAVESRAKKAEADVTKRDKRIAKLEEELAKVSARGYSQTRAALHRIGKRSASGIPAFTRQHASVKCELD
ncbi:hypothetical protein CONPUDRAFT_138135 [Coniophora puteana RWD-64-598 SS2]|uniref:Uncharacterized protein n=1 Tax=Coniophora puteana (strain RWD-64-598) TaxID=741705 RepID=A0A5M3MN99_CONPW|nr:uncharacterized protein CONPUDRAFT_138135 [Coniophora puteana RWD-64-598 SS2]EIW80091.1 hypothetical protein CONPUDRAFT_138135 [Coniophora puteana RWD-64-598 SS2]